MRESVGPGRRRGTVLRFWAPVYIFVAALPLGAAAPQAPSDRDLMAAMFFNIAKFTEWPLRPGEAAGAPIRVAVAGEAEFAARLEGVLKDRAVQGRSFAVVRSAEPEVLAGCHAVFLLKDSPGAKGLLAGLAGRPVLSVGETEGFSRSGGVLGFVLEGRRLHFEINLDAAARANLQFSSKLLTLARIVREEK